MTKKMAYALAGLLLLLTCATPAQDGFWRPDYDGIRKAVEREDCVTTRNILQYNRLLANARDSTGWTLLHITARNGDFETARVLVEFGAAMDVKSQKGFTPLHESILMGNSRVAELLITRGANITLEDNEGRTPLKMAIDKGRTDIAEALRKKGATK